jgi:HAD superfamily 5'-nucleotidase-like hydrolase
LDQKQRRAVYRREMIRFVPPRFALVDTLFCLPEVCVYADMVAYLDTHATGPVDYARLFDDIRAAIDATHRDGSLKSTIQANLAHYVDPDPLLPHTLRKLRSSGKKIFLLTNSAWDYTHALMRHILPQSDEPCGHWIDYFDLVLVSSQKPGFFTGASAFADLKTSTAAGATLPENESPSAVGCAQCRNSRTKIFAGGNLKSFEQQIDCYGEQILYVGDHIYGDILRSKKTSLWRTALVVEELEDELAAMQQRQQEMARLAELERQRQNLDNQLNSQRQHWTTLRRQQRDAPYLSQRLHAVRTQRMRCRQALRSIVAEMKQLEAAVAETFNPTWGMIFKVDRENSRFGEQVCDYACLYTSRVSNFLNYSSYQYFRSPRDMLPHERDLP